MFYEIKWGPWQKTLGERVVAPYEPLRALGHGWMFFMACFSAALGLGVAMVAGRHLVDLEVANQRVEAELRRDLVVLETDADAICRQGGDAAAGSGSADPTVDASEVRLGTRTAAADATPPPVALPPPSELTLSLIPTLTLTFTQAASPPAALPPPRELPPPAPYFGRLWEAIGDNYSALFRNFFALNLWLDAFDQVVTPTLSPTLTLT